MRVSMRWAILVVGSNQGWQKHERTRTMGPTLSRSLLWCCGKLAPLWRQIWRTYYIIPKLFRHHLFFPMDWCGVYETERVLGMFGIIQEPEGGRPTLHTLHAYCWVLYWRFFIGGSLSEIVLRTTPLLEPQEAYARAPLECSGKDTT
jgi:hypothetical protein